MSKELELNNVEDLAQILDTVSEKVPPLIRGIVSSFYSADAGRDMGRAVGSFYQELVAAGIPEKDALEMAKNYMISLKNISSIIQEAPKDND